MKILLEIDFLDSFKGLSVISVNTVELAILYFEKHELKQAEDAYFSANIPETISWKYTF